MVKNRNRLIRRSRADVIFDTVNFTLVVILTLLIIYPIYFTIIVSISDIDAVALGKVMYKPVGFTMDSYKAVFQNRNIGTGYVNSILYSIGAVAYGLFITLPLAYALSKKEMAGRTVVAWFFIITMYFSGGMIPGFLLRKSLGLLNSPWVLILGAASTYNMVIARTYFQNSIPGELYESARCDGASEFLCFFRIALPLSTPIIAVLGLYFAVGQWNNYFSAMIYLTKADLYPLQLILRNILTTSEQMLTNPEMSDIGGEEAMNLIRQARLAETMKYALIFIASAPLLIVYPFVQKFFVKGMMIGALKG